MRRSGAGEWCEGTSESAVAKLKGNRANSNCPRTNGEKESRRFPVPVGREKRSASRLLGGHGNGGMRRCAATPALRARANGAKGEREIPRPRRAGEAKRIPPPWWIRPWRDAPLRGYSRPTRFEPSKALPMSRPPSGHSLRDGSLRHPGPRSPAESTRE